MVKIEDLDGSEKFYKKLWTPGRRFNHRKFKEYLAFSGNHILWLGPNVFAGETPLKLAAWMQGGLVLENWCPRRICGDKRCIKLEHTNIPTKKAFGIYNTVGDLKMQDITTNIFARASDELAREVHGDLEIDDPRSDRDDSASGEAACT